MGQRPTPVGPGVQANARRVAAIRRHAAIAHDRFAEISMHVEQLHALGELITETNRQFLLSGRDARIQHELGLLEREWADGNRALGVELRSFGRWLHEGADLNQPSEDHRILQPEG